MRVTSQMLTTNSLNNISRNKKYMNTKGDQYATGQAIQKPSDDPVIAVRTLKYRSQLTKIEQYLDNNIPEALSWMEITESALSGVNDLVKNINTYCNQAVNGYLELTDRNSIVATLEEYKDQLFDLGNTDYAGRYVFTGYRTDTPLMFEEATTNVKAADHTTYAITENLKYSDITEKAYVISGAEYNDDITEGNEYAAMAPSLGKANRLQLSYNNLDEDGVKTVRLTDDDGNYITITEQGSIITTFDADGNPVDTAGNYQLISKSLADYNALDPNDFDLDEYNKKNPYTAEDDEIVYIEETGELIFGKNVMTDAIEFSQISVEYEKTEFAKGDIRPEHYFACTTTHVNPNLAEPEVIRYTEPGVQSIQYEMNTNQKLTVNTLAKDCLSTSISTKLDEIIRAVNDVFDIKEQIKEAEKTLQNTEDEDKIAAINTYIEQLKTEQTLKEKVLTETFSSALTTTQQAEEETNVAIADIGARYTRGTLIQSRLEDQETTVTELLSDIFYVDLEDAIIEYNAAQTYYNASLMCASTVVQQSLLDYLR